MVITILHRHLPPVIRYNVRDLARIIGNEPCRCGGCFRRMDKFLGRSDDMVKLRGVNIYPMACLPAIKSDPRTTGEWICVVDRHQRDGVLRDEMIVRVEMLQRRGRCLPAAGEAGAAAAERSRRQGRRRAGDGGQPGGGRQSGAGGQAEAPARSPPAQHFGRQAMRLFDCHSHWSTKRGYIFQSEDELASQERIWGTKASFQTEQEMTDAFRRNNVRVMMDLAVTVLSPMTIDEIRALHDYTFEVQRQHSDVIFGHWLSFDPRLGKEAIREYERAVAAKAGLIGFGIIGQAKDGFPASDPIWDPFYKTSIDAGVPVLIHCGLTGIGQGAPGGRGIVLDDGHPRHIDKVAARFPGAEDPGRAAGLSVAGRDDRHPAAQGQCALRAAWLVAESFLARRCGGRSAAGCRTASCSAATIRC